jgi:DNA-binding LacI/PurR family transcriptional regulator
MRQIADRAGVNRSTVSLALRNDQRLRPATRERIQALAAEMGYRQNPTVAQLMTQLRAGQQKHFQCNLAVLNFGPQPSVDDKFWRAAQKRAQTLGYGLELFQVQDTSPQRLEQILVNRGIRGVLLFSLWGVKRLPDDFRPVWDRFACCCVGIHPGNPDLHFVSDDNYFTSMAAVESLSNLGFTRIGMAMQASINIETEYRFVGGYLAAHRANSKLKQIPLILLGKTDRKGFLSWYRRSKPEVVICIQEEILEWLNEAGYEVPGDVSLVHLDLDATTSGNWAGMQQDRASRSAYAVDVVVTQINHNEMGPPPSQVAMLIESVWKNGATVGHPRQKRRKEVKLES